MIDEDPVMLASVERRIDRLLDATAARLVAGGAAPREAADPRGVARTG